MLAILNVIAPVFAVIGLGYSAVRFKLYPASGVSGLVYFVNNFATPFLLFRAMLNADFNTAFNPSIILSFYAGAFVVLFGGAFIARRFFGSRPGESVSSGFAAGFTNTVLIGIPILQRAYGEGAMSYVYSIIGFHAPVLMTAGMVAMEFARRDGGKIGDVLKQAGIRAASNPLLWGIFLGIICNRAGVHLIEPADAFTLMLAQAVLPVALFSLGGALNEYGISQNWPQAAVMSGLKLIVQPLIAFVIMVPILRVDPMIARYGVLLASMPSGINVYVFATLYKRGENVAANTILISTALSLFTISGWLLILSL